MKRLLLPTGLAIAALFAGCGKRETAVEAGNREQILHFGNLAEPSDLDPQLVNSQQDFQIVMNLVEGLAMYDPQTCLPIPGVAERWETSADGLTWTFYLRKNAVWSNGDPVTAQDFVWSYQRVLSPGLGAEYAYMLYALVNGEAYHRGQLTDFAQVGVKATDPHTLVLTLDHAVPYLDKLVCHSVWFPVHRATIEKYGRIDQRGTQWTRPGNYVGNGAFVLKEWKPNQVIVLAKSPTYWERDQVRLQEAHIYPIESVGAEEAAFRAGQLHITAQIPQDKIAVYRQENPELLHQETTFATYFYRFNVTRPPLNDVRVRRALSLAIDRRAIVERVAKGGQPPAFSLTPPGVADYTGPAPFAEDIAEAQRLLAEAGFPNGQGFPKVEILYNTTETHRTIAEAIQQMWRKNLNVDIGLYNQEAKVWNDSMRQLDYQIARFAWVGDYLDPSTFLDIMTSASGNNQTGWGSAEYDRLIEQASRTGEQSSRYDLYRRAEAILVAEAPIMPIYFYTRNNLRRPSVKGWTSNLLDLHALKYVHLEP